MKVRVESVKVRVSALRWGKQQHTMEHCPKEPDHQIFGPTSHQGIISSRTDRNDDYSTEMPRSGRAKGLRRVEKWRVDVCRNKSEVDLQAESKYFLSPKIEAKFGIAFFG